MGNDLLRQDRLYDMVVVNTKQYLETSDMGWSDEIARNVQGTYKLIRSAMEKSNTKPVNYQFENIIDMIKSSLIFGLSATMIPAQCYIISRSKGYNSDKYELQYGIQGNGWEVIAETFGKNVKRVMDVIVVKEGDTYMENFYERGELVPFTYKPYQGTPKQFREEWGHATRRTTNVVFVMEMIDHTTKFLSAERESVKKSIIAQVKQNIMYSELNEKQQRELLVEMDNYTVDELLYDDGDIEWTKRTYPKKVWDNGKKVLKEMFVISDNYISPSAKESMIETKMRSEALKRLPKTFDNYQQKLFEDTYDFDYREEKKNRADVVDVSPEDIVEKHATEFSNEIEKEEVEEVVIENTDELVVENEEVEVKVKNVGENDIQSGEVVKEKEEHKIYKTNDEVLEAYKNQGKQDKIEKVEKVEVVEPHVKKADWLDNL